MNLMIYGSFSKAEGAISPTPVSFCMFSRGRLNKKGECRRFTILLEFIRSTHKVSWEPPIDEGWG